MVGILQDTLSTRTSLRCYTLEKEDSKTATYPDKLELDSQMREEIKNHWGVCAKSLDRIVPDPKQITQSTITTAKIYGVLFRV